VVKFACPLLLRLRAGDFFKDPARLLQLEKDPDYQPLRSHPEFQELLRKQP
jgi:hypothetical protein